MTEKSVEVKLKTGLQARQAALFVQAANRFSSERAKEYGLIDHIMVRNELPK